MALGPGKYDDLCMQICEKTGISQHGGGVILIVVNGDRGHGFSVTADLPTMITLPDMLESVAKSIREDLGRTREKEQSSPYHPARHQADD